MEVLSIRIENIDLDRRVIYIPRAKAGAREQPITGNLAEFLFSYVDAAQPEQEWLFPSVASETGHKTAIEKPFRRAVEQADLDPKVVVRHTLRHTAISHLVQAGVDLPTVQRISGHKTLEMVIRYSHQNGEHIQAAMDKLEERYAVS
ncbi:MAG: tyrosine-type recombinase/integrase [SAR324 cluster bacterium]|nr:tyrosine-type recombinase/integrase [SAR324 cluster bacterium]